MFDAFTAVATLAQAGTQIHAGVSARSAANKQADVADRAASIARADEIRKGRRLAGKQRAAFAKGGVEIDEGTPLDVLAQTAADAETDALRAALAFEQEADDLRSMGKVALTSGILGAGATILGQSRTFEDLFGGSTPTRKKIAPSGFVLPKLPVTKAGMGVPIGSTRPIKVI